MLGRPKQPLCPFWAGFGLLAAGGGCGLAVVPALGGEQPRQRRRPPRGPHRGWGAAGPSRLPRRASAPARPRPVFGPQYRESEKLPRGTEQIETEAVEEAGSLFEYIEEKSLAAGGSTVGKLNLNELSKLLKFQNANPRNNTAEEVMKSVGVEITGMVTKESFLQWWQEERNTDAAADLLKEKEEARVKAMTVENMAARMNDMASDIARAEIKAAVVSK